MPRFHRNERKAKACLDQIGRQVKDGTLSFEDGVIHLQAAHHVATDELAEALVRQAVQRANHPRSSGGENQKGRNLHRGFETPGPRVHQRAGARSGSPATRSRTVR